MIVKNESTTITRCMESARRLIDYVLIVDTGSTDGTQDAIRNFCRDTSLQGEVIEEPWQDFAANRTSALAWLRKQQHIDYALLMDADDQIVYNSKFNVSAFKAGLSCDIYDGVFRIERTAYHRPLLCRNRLDFRYRGVLHEFLEGPAEASRSTITDFYIAEKREGVRNRNPNKYLDDALVLERAIATEKDPLLLSRYTFYLAQSYRDAGRREQALTNYLKRADLGYWDQEVFVSLWCAAQLKEELGHPDTEIIGSYLKAYEACPSRAESLHDAMRYCAATGKYQLGYMIGKHAVTIPNPGPAGLLIQTWVYEYALFNEFATNAFFAGQYQESLHYCQKILSQDLIPPEKRPAIQRNADLVRATLASLRSRSGTSKVSPALGRKTAMGGKRRSHP